MTFYTLSDKGKVRSNNEDYAESFQINWCGPLGNRIEITALVLADGMGGAAAGEFASMLAVKTIKENLVRNLFEKQPEDLLNSDKTIFLESCIEKANQEIYGEACRNPEYDGMGTTIVAGLIHRTTFSLAHVGDSRCYRFRNDKLEMLTRDHSLVQEFVDAGRITMDEAFVHPQRNVITRALGIGEETKVDRNNVALEDGDLLIMCSDGLCGYVDNDGLTDLIGKTYNKDGTDLQLLSENLIKAAYINGGGDNITVCLYQHQPKQS